MSSAIHKVPHISQVTSGVHAELKEALFLWPLPASITPWYFGWGGALEGPRSLSHIPVPVVVFVKASVPGDGAASANLAGGSCFGE